MTITKSQLIAKAATLVAEGKALAETINSNDERIQIYLCSEYAQIAKHKNPTRLNTFFHSIKRSGVRVMAMHKHAQVFAPIRWDENAEFKAAGKDAKGNYPKGCYVYDKSTGYDLEKALDSDWTTFKSEQARPVFNLHNRVETFLKAAIAADYDLEAVQAELVKVAEELKVKADQKAAEELAKAAKKAEQANAKAAKSATPNQKAKAQVAKAA